MSGNTGNFFRNGLSPSRPLAPSGGEGQGEGVFRRVSSIIAFASPHLCDFALILHSALRSLWPLDIRLGGPPFGRLPSSILYPPSSPGFAGLPPRFKRANADFCGLSAFFHRTLLHSADFQPLASPKPHRRSHLIPMVRKTSASAPLSTCRIRREENQTSPHTQYATRNTRHASRNFFLSPHYPRLSAVKRGYPRIAADSRLSNTELSINLSSPFQVSVCSVCLLFKASRITQHATHLDFQRSSKPLPQRLRERGHARLCLLGRHTPLHVQNVCQPDRVNFFRPFRNPHSPHLYDLKLAEGRTPNSFVNLSIQKYCGRAATV